MLIQYTLRILAISYMHGLITKTKGHTMLAFKAFHAPHPFS